MKKLKKRLTGKIQSLIGEPRIVARSFAMGSFIGVSPLIGMQVILSLALAGIFRLSKTASVVGVLNTNWTKGLFLYPVNYKLGAWLLGNSANINIQGLLSGNVFKNLYNAGPEVFISLLIGGFMTGTVISIVYYFLVLEILKQKETKIIKSKDTMNNQQKKYALVTGASRGIGKEMAYELAARKINLLLVSLKGEGLKDLCQEIRDKYGVDAQYFETDFYKYESVYEVANWAISNYNPYILINNAGIGGTKAFESVPPEYIDAIIQVNIRATSMLTRLLLPELKKHNNSYILNVASMAAFSPFAFKTVYPASKAFVYSFSEGLREELKGTGVFVSVIHPGPVKTNPDVTARIEKQGVLGRMGQVSPQELANIAIRQLFNKDSFILPGILNKINWLLMILVPNNWKLTILSRVIRKEIKSYQPAIPCLSIIKS